MKPECIARLAAAEHRLSSRPVRKLVKLSVSSLADVTKKAEGVFGIAGVRLR